MSSDLYYNLPEALCQGPGMLQNGRGDDRNVAQKNHPARAQVDKWPCQITDGEMGSFGGGLIRSVTVVGEGQLVTMVPGICIALIDTQCQRC